MSKQEKPRLKIIFVAGPYFGDGSYNMIDQNIRDAEAFQIALVNRGIHCFCAHNHTNHFEVKAKASEIFYKAFDTEVLRILCDAVLAMPRWKESSGARDEIKWAEENNVPIFFPKSSEDLDEIEHWFKET